jgi:hypothetical protein
MNETISKEDQDWLDALAGKTAEGIDPLQSSQALAVRKALIERRETIEADAVTAGSIGLDKVRKRLQLEGLMKADKTNQSSITWWNRVIGILGLGAGGNGARTMPVWGVAAVLVVAVLVTFQVYGPQVDESQIYRGDPKTTTLIVDNPEQRANELAVGLRPLSPTTEIIQLPAGRYRLKVQASQAVIDYLQTQRIEPVAVDKFITIDVVPAKK